MDCRKTLGLGLFLLMGAAGCSHNVMMGPSAPPAQASNAPAPAFTPVQVLPPGAVVQKAADLPPRTPHAATCVAFGDWAASEANAADLSDTARQSKREKARKAYQQALSIDPRYMPAYESLASLYSDLKDHSHAVATYRKAASMFPNEPRVFYELGKCYGGDKEWQPAIESLTRAVELDPENRQYVDTLGWMQARVGLYDDSLATFRKVHDMAEAHYRLALMLEHLNQPELCKQHLQIALEKDPHQQRARALLAKLDEAPTDPVQAAVYTEAAKPQPTDEAPTTAEAPAPPTPASRGRVIILPPPPQISIEYDAGAAPSPHEGE
jgi:tetratricopeptide (TPR) repeat protein